MATKNKKYRNWREQRRVELLKEQYEYDEATRTFDIVLHYQKASELFNEHLDLSKKRVMKDEVLEEAANLLSDIPSGYKADLSIVIDDYEGIPYQVILDAFHNVAKFRVSRYLETTNRKYHKVGILVLIGIFLIALMILGEVMGWWGGEALQGRLFSYVIDTAGCVLIWEGLYSALLERGYDAALGHTLSTRLASVGLYGNDDSDQALLLEKHEHVVEKGVIGKKVGASFLYLSGFFLVGSGVMGMILRAPMIREVIANYGATALMFSLFLEFLSFVALCGLGILAILMFNENYRYFILSSIVAALLLVAVIISFAQLFFVERTPVNIITSTVPLIAMTLYVIGFALSTYHHWGDIKKTIRGE